MRDGRLLVHAPLAAAYAIVVFYNAALNRIHATSTPMVLLLLLIWGVGIWELDGGRRRDVVLGGAAYLAFVVVTTRFLSHTYPAVGADALEKLLALAPASAAAGWVLVRTGRIVQYLSWVLVIGLVTVLPAVGEYVANRPLLLTNRSFARNGQMRAVVGADHPLVLATLFLACIPLAFYLLGRWRYVAAVALYVGVLTTGSNGPELVGAVLLVCCAVRPLARLMFTTVSPLIVLLAGLGGYLTFGGLFWWGPQIRGFSTTDVSNGYRAALYHLMIQLLTTHPLGYGPHGLPANTWYFDTQTGIVDAAASLDSELVYGITQFGYLWIGVFALVAGMAIAAVLRNQAIALSSLSVTFAGLFLAIHSWNSLGSFWEFGFGTCVALVVGYGGTCDWRELGTPDRVRFRPRLLALV